VTGRGTQDYGRPDAGATPSLVRVSTVVYGVMAGIGSALCLFGHGTLATVFAPPAALAGGLKLVAIGGLLAGLLLILSWFFEDWFPSYKEIKEAFILLLGPASVLVAVYLALLSAFAEEILFRGAIQPYVGVVVTSALFGVLHMGPSGKFTAWSLWALIAGLLLGWSFKETGSLWPPVLAHFTVNCVSLLSLRREWRRRAARAADEGSGGAAGDA
jgi:uncharacterized protein